MGNLKSSLLKHEGVANNSFPIKTSSSTLYTHLTESPNPSINLIGLNLFLEKSVHKIFEEEARNHPNDIAVEHEGITLTYSELNRRSNQLAHYLKSLGVKSEIYVGLSVESNLQLIIGILGIMKAGGVYLPLDPSYPADRLQYILHDAKPSVLLTQSNVVQKFKDYSGKLVLLDGDTEITSYPESDFEGSAIQPDTLAYVIYTSGSTGNPKGVMINHRGLANVVLARLKFYPEKSNMLLLNSIGFDMSIMIIFHCLISGGILYLPGLKPPINTDQLAALIHAHRVNFLLCVPSLYTMLLQRKEDFSSIKHVVLGGEDVSSSLVELHCLHNSHAFLYNEYGPTECSICATVGKIYDPLEGKSTQISIGKPIANTQIYILDENLQSVPPGHKGEMCIGGKGLARGYLNRPDLTEEKFTSAVVVDKDGCEQNIRLYRTGDHGRFLLNGDIEFLGRVDHQVKIRGYRIELGEIEHALCQHPEIKEAVVIASEDTTDNKVLIAYFSSLSDLSVETLRLHLSTLLPKHMIPSYFLKRDHFSLTPNGKIDRKALSNLGDFNRPKVESTASCSEMELSLLNIWQKTLKVEEINLHENFFDMGGDSLLVANLQILIKENLNLHIPIIELFQYPTISQLAVHLTNQHQERLGTQFSLAKNLDTASKKKNAFNRFKHSRLESEQKSYG